MPVRTLRLAAVMLLALFLAACASRQVDYTPPPPEMHAFAGEVRQETFVNSDGLNLFGQMWMPHEDPRAVVVLLHGTTMHSGLYDEFGRYLAEQKARFADIIKRGNIRIE